MKKYFAGTIVVVVLLVAALAGTARVANLYNTDKHHNGVGKPFNEDIDLLKDWRGAPIQEFSESGNLTAIIVSDAGLKSCADAIKKHLGMSMTARDLKNCLISPRFRTTTDELSYPVMFKLFKSGHFQFIAIPRPEVTGGME